MICVLQYPVEDRDPAHPRRGLSGILLGLVYKTLKNYVNANRISIIRPFILITSTYTLVDYFVIIAFIISFTCYRYDCILLYC